MYKCLICKYITDKKYNIDKHEESLKHKRNVHKKIKEDELIKLEKEKNRPFRCKCGKSYKGRSGLWNHKNSSGCSDNISISNEHIIIENNGLVTYKCFCGKTYKSRNGLWKHKKTYDCQKSLIEATNHNPNQLLLQAVSNSNNTANIVINNYTTTNSNNTNIQNTHVINQANLMYPNAPNLETIKNFNYLDSGGIKEFIDDILYNYRLGYLDKYYARYILKYYKKNDLNEQSIFNTDSTRLNFIIKLLIKEESKWRKDIKGLQTIEVIIGPMLKYTYDIITEYLKYINDEKRSKKRDLDEMCIVVNINSDLGLIQRSIKTGELERKILKEIAPYFNMNGIKHMKKEELDYSTKKSDRLAILDKLNRSDESDKIEETYSDINFDINSDESLDLSNTSEEYVEAIEEGEGGEGGERGELQDALENIQKNWKNLDKEMLNTLLKCEKK